MIFILQKDLNAIDKTKIRLQKTLLKFFFIVLPLSGLQANVQECDATKAQ